MSHSETILLGHLLCVQLPIGKRMSMLFLYCIRTYKSLWQKLIPQIDLIVQENCKSIEVCNLIQTRLFCDAKIFKDHQIIVF